MPALVGPGPAGAACTTLGGSILCDGELSHAQVGRIIVFPHGPAGERVGDFVVRPEGSLPQVLPREAATPRPGPRPLNRADRLTEPTRGRDFGAFEFPSGPSPLGHSPDR